jgi:hypothetical protein
MFAATRHVMTAGKGLSDPFWADTKLLIKSTAASGIYDATGLNTLTAISTVNTSSTQTKYLDRSIYFDGNNQLRVTDANTKPDLRPGTGDFTTEAWIFPTGSLSDYRTFFTKGYVSNGGIVVQTGFGDGKFIVYASGSVVITSSIAVTLGSWFHVALCRNGSTLTLYVNGSSAGSATNSTNFNITDNLDIAGANSYYLQCYMSEYRFTKAARYTSSFTPPAAALPVG